MAKSAYITVTGLTVVTGDLRDFSPFPDLEVLNPWI
jgi:predicted nucleic acid-binding protein